jgi:hypothetical protein
VRRVVQAWLPLAGQAEILRGEDQGQGLDRVALGRWVRTLPLVRALLVAAHRRPLAPAEVDAVLARELPRFAAGSTAQRSGWLAAALTMLSYAQREVGGHVTPLVSVQATLWVREVRRLLARVGPTPAFRFHDDAPPPADEAWAPPLRVPRVRAHRMADHRGGPRRHGRSRVQGGRAGVTASGDRRCA